MMKRRLVGSYISSVVSIALVLLLVGAALLLVGAAGSVADYFKESMQVSVILRQDVDEAAAESYRARIDSLPCVRRSRVVTREEGIREMKEMLGEDFLNVFQTAPIPVSVELSLKAAYVSADSLGVVKQALSDPVVEDIDWQQSMMEALGSNIAKISVVLGLFILLLLFISFVLIGNTVRLDVFSRRFTIRTMKMVGATRAFIRRPFIGRAVLQGLAASLLGLALLAGVCWLVLRGFPGAASVAGPALLGGTAAALVVLGVVICVVSTWLVVNNLLSLRKDRFYF